MEVSFVVGESRVFQLSWAAKSAAPVLALGFVALGAFVPVNGAGLGSGFWAEFHEATWPLYIVFGAWLLAISVRNLLQRRPIELDDDRLVVRNEINHIKPHVILKSDVAHVAVSDGAVEVHGSDGLLCRAVGFQVAESTTALEAELRTRWPDVRIAD